MEKEKNRYALWLLVLCWLAYTCSYIGKLSYSANINQVERAFHVSYKQAGLGYFALSKAKARREKNCQAKN